MQAPRTVRTACRHLITRRCYSSRPPQPKHSVTTTTTTTTGDGTKQQPPRTKMTWHQLGRLQRPVAMMTAHDYPSALLCDRAGVDVVLVGDSLAMVALGMESTAAVTMDEMLHHAKAVKRGTEYALLVGDMPFGSYQPSNQLAVQNAIRFVQEAGMEAVKMEGGSAVMVERVASVVQGGVAVVGHIGLTPQSQAQLGGYRVQGRTANAAKVLVQQALELRRAGCSMLVLEAIPAPVAQHITQCLLREDDQHHGSGGTVRTVGIGAGAECGGQVLVQQDMLGIYDDLALPRFCKQYARVGETALAAMRAYVADVHHGRFPSQEHTYRMADEELERFQKR